MDAIANPRFWVLYEMSWQSKYDWWYVYYTMCVLYNTCITQYVYYTIRVLYNVCIIQYVYYTICVLYNMCIIQYVHYTICVLYNMTHQNPSWEATNHSFLEIRFYESVNFINLVLDTKTDEARSKNILHYSEVYEDRVF